jgi:hypothetical protein
LWYSVYSIKKSMAKRFLKYSICNLQYSILGVSTGIGSAHGVPLFQLSDGAGFGGCQRINWFW